MASAVNGMGSSGLSSIYGNRTVISGLASGLDTESMIEKAISGHKMKISSLYQSQTKVMWQQSMFRGMIDKMASFTNKYTSYASSTNLLSKSFFSNNLLVNTQGPNADKISATGKPTSNVQILGVKNLATSATYNTKLKGTNQSSSPIKGSNVDLDSDVKSTEVSGSLTLTHNGKNIKVDIGNDVYENADKLAEGIQKQLDEKYKDSKIKAEVSGNSIKFTSNGAEVKITGASGKIKDTLGVDSNNPSNTLNVGSKALYSTKSLGETLSGKEIKVTLNGKTATIKLPDNTTQNSGNDIFTTIQKQVKDAFGDKVEVENSATDNTKLNLTFKLKDGVEGSTLDVSGAKELGLASDRESSYVNGSKTLEDILGKDYWNGKDKTDFTINGVNVGSFSKTDSIDSVMKAINENDKAGVKVSFSKMTNQFQFTATETGAQGKIEFGDGLAKELFGEAKEGVSGYTKGQNAVVSMKVNGQLLDGVEYSDNTIDMDGMKVTLKDTFGKFGSGNKLENASEAEKDAVKFTTNTDTDKLMNVIKDMVKDYNELLKEIHDAYSTMPETKTDGSRYEPLTEEKKEKMSESEIKNYEEKAKKGLLFGNRELSNLYSELTSALSPGVEDTGILREIGIEVSFKDGLNSITLDENKLRTALENDPDKVEDMFTKRVSTGAKSDGLMQTMKNVMDKYGSTTGSNKGILVDHAGANNVPSTQTNNALQKMIDDYQKQIDQWTTKMTKDVDTYTMRFSKLEQLIAQMNSQSQALMGMMGN